MDLNEDSLFTAITTLRANTPSEGWVQRLNAKIQELRQRVLFSQDFSFSPPRVIGIPKNRKEHEYRPLALFSRDDRIVISLVARYLREALDRVLLPCCLAFRPGSRLSPKNSGRQPPTIHDALEAILEINEKNRHSGLYVAECDIRAFYDCVAHGTAQRALEEAIDEAKQVSPSLEIDRRARRVFEAYLKSYNFEDSVLRRCLSNLCKRDVKAKFNWPAEDLRVLHGRESLPRIGIPQGGALSCLIANLVLHAADKEIRKVCHESTADFRYMRYCDDMIILAADRNQCERAYQRYFDTLLHLRLPAHPAKEVEKYGRSFWAGKSNATYHWFDKSKGGIPWIQFVGYQIRYDGLVRVRPKSLRKHFRKLTTTADELFKALIVDGKDGSRIGARKTKHQILHRFRQKMISLSVGRVKLAKPADGPLPMCWANGFRGLLGKRIIATHLKALDRHRERQIRRVERRIAGLQVPRDRTKSPKGVLPFYGYPFSYFAQFRVAPPRTPSRLAAWCGKCKTVGAVP
ncbi:MAG TPA: reverse transcriptase domain-containing protein [Bryobacteraceae bacterium]|nr:reverse transcriptase domain-containing protein [Bryobacteraceae bacterium]HPU71851.1 reverse transcriptase domain-containing protein [Bryobacteraceae bacterium]